MSNRRKISGSAPMREPLLAALDVEYGHALKAKNLDRAAEITDIVQRIKGWDSAPAEPPTLVEQVVALHTAPVPDLPDPLPIPPPPVASNLPPAPFALQDLLNSVPEGLWGDDERRAEAKGRVRDVVLRAAHATLGDQMRYELALQAYNRNTRALELFEPEAVALKITVADLASRIITERRTAERRMQHAYTVLARVSGDIDQATGDAIEALAEAGIREIQEMGE